MHFQNRAIYKEYRLGVTEFIQALNDGPVLEDHNLVYSENCLASTDLPRLALLYKLLSKSTGKNFVTNVYCFYL